MALLMVPVIAPAQDSAMEERLNQLSAQIDVLKEAREIQNKRIEALEKQVSELQAKANQPAGDYASTADLKKVADAVTEVDKKRKADSENVADQLEKIRKAVIGPSNNRRTSVPQSDTPKPAFDPATPHMEHKVEPGETLSAIASAYRAKGVKVSVQQILEANHIADPKNVKIGQVLIIPAGQ